MMREGVALKGPPDFGGVPGTSGLVRRKSRLEICLHAKPPGGAESLATTVKGPRARIVESDCGARGPSPSLTLIKCGLHICSDGMNCGKPERTNKKRTNRYGNEARAVMRDVESGIREDNARHQRSWMLKCKDDEE